MSGDRSDRLCPPAPRGRRTRRGLLALSVAMLVSGTIAALMLAWQIAEARVRLAGEADAVVAAVAARGYALHHWLNEDPDPGLRPQAPASGQARRLTAAETTALAGHGATAGWGALPRGWEVIELIAEPEGQEGVPLPHGVIVLDVPPGAQVGPVDLARAVRTTLAADLGDGAAADLAATAVAGFDPAVDVALFAWRFGGVDDSGVLSSRRAGFPPPRMAQDLDLAGNDITDGRRVEAVTLSSGSVGPRDDGDPATLDTVTFANGMRVGTDVIAPMADFTLANPLTVTGRLSARNVNASGVGVDDQPATAATEGMVTITGQASASALSACNAVATGCNGGDLTIDGATGDPSWTQMAVFGEADFKEATTTALTVVRTATFTRAAAITADDVTATHVFTGTCTGCGP